MITASHNRVERVPESRAPAGFDNPAACPKHLWTVVVALMVFSPALTTSATVVYWPLNAFELVAHQRADSLACSTQLVQIMRASQLWANDHADQPPLSFQDFTVELGSPAALFCPAHFRASAPTNWAEVDWDQIDYQWAPDADWGNSTNIACRCKVHESTGLVDGSVRFGGYRTGWPLLTAAPLEVYATPGEMVRFDTRLAPDALSPVSYQWRQSHLSFETNVVRVPNTDDPLGVYWATNVVPVFTAIELGGQTNSALLLLGVGTGDSAFYSVVISNAMGASVSRQTRLQVDPAVAGMSTNQLCLESRCASTLKQIWLFALAWSYDHQSQLPPDFEMMTNRFGVTIFGWPLVLFCPSDTNHIAPRDWPEVGFEKTSYEVVLNEDLYGGFCHCRFHGYYVETEGEVMTRPYFKNIHPQPGFGVELVFKVFAGKLNVLEASKNLV